VQCLDASVLHRTEPHLSRLGGLLYLPQSLRQQFLFPQVLRHGNGALNLLTRLNLGRKLKIASESAERFGIRG
jgi:hypothetical protein